MTSIRDWLAPAVMPREDIDVFLDEKQPNWARFDPELGYVLRDSVQHDGIDDSHTILRFETGGAREIGRYKNLTPRLNTYGDSFTQCSQVSDGETWQEQLAAHLGEPIRNYGIGGYGVYQAWRRLRRVEAGPEAAKHIILTIWGDDHHRSLHPSRWLFIHGWWAKNSRRNKFHCNPWVHLEPEARTRTFLERPNPVPTPQRLYELTTVDGLMAHFASNPIIQLLAWGAGAEDADQQLLSAMAEWVGIGAAWRTSGNRKEVAGKIFTGLAHRATLWILEQAHTWAVAEKRKLMIGLSYGDWQVIADLKGAPREDRLVLDWLTAHDLPWFDLLAAHHTDFVDFKCTPEAYAKRYFVGHYNPRGNQFFAYAIKDTVVSWLEPKPRTYASRGPSISFDGYLDADRGQRR